MCNCSSFRENCVTHARTHTHGANYNLPPASRAGDKNKIVECKLYTLMYTCVQILHRILTFKGFNSQLEIVAATQYITRIKDLTTGKKKKTDPLPL